MHAIFERSLDERSMQWLLPGLNQTWFVIFKYSTKSVRALNNLNLKILAEYDEDDLKTSIINLQATAKIRSHIVLWSNAGIDKRINRNSRPSEGISSWDTSRIGQLFSNYVQRLLQNQTQRTSLLPKSRTLTLILGRGKLGFCQPLGLNQYRLRIIFRCLFLERREHFQPIFANVRSNSHHLTIVLGDSVGFLPTSLNPPNYHSTTSTCLYVAMVLPMPSHSFQELGFGKCGWQYPQPCNIQK